MTTLFTPDVGTRMLQLIHKKNWKVCYEWRNWGNPDAHQSMEEIFAQVATSLENGPRYHVYPGTLEFNEFMKGAIEARIQLPRVTIAGEKRILFGFGIRDDHCFFVTNDQVQIASADREPKDYDFVLAALETLESFIG